MLVNLGSLRSSLIISIFASKKLRFGAGAFGGGFSCFLISSIYLCNVATSVGLALGVLISNSSNSRCCSNSNLLAVFDAWRSLIILTTASIYSWLFPADCISLTLFAIVSPDSASKSPVSLFCLSFIRSKSRARR